MAVRIRLKKMGRKHQPSFRIVAADSRCKRDGKVIEELGHYNPLAKDKEQQVIMKLDRVEYWLSVGAQPSETVAGMIKRAKVS